MLEIEFHDREKEIDEITSILNARPDLITFVYGPINSGKTELLQHLIRTLPKDFVVFYVNLRGRFIKDYEDFTRVLFKFKNVEKEEIMKDVLKQSLKALSFKGIPVPESVVDIIFARKKTEDVFEFLEDYLSNIAEKKMPILIIDELQVIGDININGPLIYKLFNFFVRLSKELHTCHIFAVTSDSLFIEKVFNEAMLQGRCRYLLVDDFDYETTRDFLRKYDFSNEEIELVWNYFGGKPVYLVEAVKNKRRLSEFCESWLRLRKRQIKDSLYSLSDDFRKSVLNLFSAFKDKEIISYERLSEELIWCVKNNILFVDPMHEIVKPQSRLDLLAIRKVLNTARINSKL